jgi:RimJ/RimL family protein N-acetyltransferase
MPVRLEQWGEDDLWLVEALMGDPEMTEHLGGPESSEKLRERQARYVRTESMFKLVDEETGEAVGSVGFWEKDWHGEQIYETGWMVLKAHQGRGIATEATALVVEKAKAKAKAKANGRRRYLHAFPPVANGASNAICRKLGFTLLGEVEFEFPPGHFATSNDWRLDLTAY